MNEKKKNEKKGIPVLAAPRIQRWALTLSAYEYKISYKAGQTNGNADGLSRLPLPEMPESVPVPGEKILLRGCEAIRVINWDEFFFFFPSW